MTFQSWLHLIGDLQSVPAALYEVLDYGLMRNAETHSFTNPSPIFTYKKKCGRGERGKIVNKPVGC